MRKIKEVLRLRFELGLGQREIARACSISQGAVHNYLKKAAGAGMQWPLPEGWDEKQIEEAVFGKQRSIEESSQRAFPDFPALHNQLQQHPHLTLQLAWEEYREKDPEGYRYSWFCELYGQWRGKQDVVLRQEHKAGEKGFVDWAGATIPVQDPDTGGIWQASLFVMVLGASSYTYAEATRDQQLSAWIGSHIHAFEYFGGVPRLLVPDNPRTGVSRACRYDPDLNPTYQEMAMHYGVGVVPARPYRPRDKAKVEVGVQIVERWIVGRAASPAVFPAGRSEPRDPGTAGAVEPAAVPETRRIACQSVRLCRTQCTTTVADRAIRHEPVVAGPGEHRLPHRLRGQPVQCALYVGSRTGGSESDSHNCRDLPQGAARGLASSWAWPRAGNHRARTSAQEPPSASGVDSLTHGEQGRADRTAHGTIIRTDPGREAASGNGLSILFGNHPARRTVLGGKDGSGSGSGPAGRRLPLPEREIDPEELAGPTTADRRALASSLAASRQHPGRRILQ